MCILWLALSSVLFAQGNLYQEALERYKDKQYQDALPIAEDALRQDANNATKVHLYGLILAALDQTYLAEQNLRKAVELQPDRSAFDYDLGYVLHQEKKYDEALPVLKRAVELDPENLPARFLLARTYVLTFHTLKISNFTELALEQLNFIVKRNPGFPAVHHHIALIFINSGEPAKALEELNTELRFFPANIQARLELGETLLKLNQPRRAIEELFIAAKQAPQNHLVEFALAKAYKSDGQTAKAIEAARRCVEIEPQSADGHYLLGQLYRDSHQPDLAQQHFDMFRKLKTSETP